MARWMWCHWRSTLSPISGFPDGAVDELVEREVGVDHRGDAPGSGSSPPAFDRRAVELRAGESSFARGEPVQHCAHLIDLLDLPGLQRRDR